ncbi:shikimate dehydrogenase [Candidatus Omnitrophota bacterium]
MNKFGLIGYPVQHSYSAIMHNAAFQELGIAASYELFEVRPEKLAADVQGLIEAGICGFNVTIPHKEKIIASLDQVTPEAELIGAVNTIKVNPDKTTQGFNTDGPGFIEHLVQAVGFDPKDKQVSILGAGGAAKAVSLQLASAGAKQITLFDIDKDKAQGLADKLTDNFSGVKTVLAAEPNQLLRDETALLINATPVGMHQEDQLVFDPGLFHSKLMVYDLIYNPAQTALLQEAKRKGCAGIFNGLGLLLYQGVLAFKIWLGIDPPIAVMEESLRKVLNQN